MGYSPQSTPTGLQQSNTISVWVCVFIKVCVCVCARSCVCVCVFAFAGTHTQTVVLVTSEALWPLFSVSPKIKKKKKKINQIFISIIWLQVLTPTPQTAPKRKKKNKQNKTQKHSENAMLDIQHGRLKPEQSRTSCTCPDVNTSQQQTRGQLTHNITVCASSEVIKYWCWYLKQIPSLYWIQTCGERMSSGMLVKPHPPPKSPRNWHLDVMCQFPREWSQFVCIGCGSG